MSRRRLELSPAEAGWLLRASMVGVAAKMRDGGRVPQYAADVLRRLAAMADADPPGWLTPGSGSGTDSSTVKDVDGFLPTASAAATVGVSAEYVRRLARQGRVRHTRVGRTWLVDPQSLANVLRRAR